MNDMFDEYKDVCDFLIVYIREAHAVDEWPLGDHVVVKQHKEIQERIDIAKEMIDKLGYKIPLVVDSIENEFAEKYSIWPERFYVINENKVKFSSVPTSKGHERDKLASYLKGQFKVQNENIE